MDYPFFERPAVLAGLRGRNYPGKISGMQSNLQV